MKKTVEIGPFFFFIHILIVSDWNIVQKHILGCECCKCGKGEGRAGDMFPHTFPPPRLCMNCIVRNDPPPAWLAYPSPSHNCPTHAIHAHSVRNQGSDVRSEEERISPTNFFQRSSFLKYLLLNWKLLNLNKRIALQEQWIRMFLRKQKI